jgi:protoporphyrinogen oxidase
MRHVKYMIIGGGITGLNFARSKNIEDYILIEKESTLGGLCRTHYQGCYVWDFAGHFFHFTNPLLKKFFDERIPKKELVSCVKNTKIIYKNKYIDYPFQKNIHQLPKREFIECLYDLYFKENKNTFTDFEDMLYAKFGKGITDKFLKPYNEKLYASSLKSLDTDAMGRFFPYAELSDIIRNMKITDDSSYNNTFQYPKNGAQVFINALTSEINMSNVLLSTELSSVNLFDKKITIKNGQKIEVISFDFLINTIPLNIFLPLCGISIEGKLSYNQVLVFNIGFDNALNDVSSHWIYFPEKKYSFYRVGFYNNILSTTKGSLYVELGFDSNFIFDDMVIQKYYKTVIEDLKKCGIVTDQSVVAYESIIINPAYVHITEYGKQWVDAQMNNLASNNIYSIGRYGSWTYCSMEDCMVQANNLSEKI